MTIEEAINELQEDIDLYMPETWVESIDRDTPDGRLITALEIAIKALEQEPILDKIRAEIEAIEDGISSYHNDRPWIFKDEALAIIDKYKEESEDKE